MTECIAQAAGTIELYVYGELEPAARAEAERHLARCPACRQSLDELKVIRSALAARPDVSSPPGADWTGFMSRLDAAIRDEQRQTPARARQTSWRAQAIVYAAMAALLAIISLSVAHILRIRVANEPDETELSAALPDAQPRAWSDDAAFAALAEQHFDRSKLVVLGLANKSAAEEGGNEWEYERELASSLLADTRLYRLTAADRGLTELARTLGDLELVLLQTSLSSTDRGGGTLEQIQRLIRKRDLVTRMNVVAARGM